MKTSRILIWTVITFIVLAAGAYVLLFGLQDNAIDVTALNDAVKTAEENMDGDVSEALSQTAYGFAFAVLDEEGWCVFRNDDRAATTAYDAIQSGGSVISFDGGTFLLTSNLKNNMRDIRKTAYGYIVGILLLAWLGCTGYLIYLNQKIIWPFDEMRRFARNIAGGNLDVPLRMDKSNLFGAFTESFDLMRAALKQARESERAATNSKKELVACLSHDIKTPLASIKALTELLEVTVQDENQRKKLETIDQKTEQISLLTNNLFSATMEELNELIVTVSEQQSLVLIPMLRTADYQNRIESCAVAEAMIDCDLMRTQQVFDNIFGNAYKYAGTAIDVSSLVSNGFLHLTILDSGGGAPESELPLMTQKFYRGENAAGKSGSGLGLYMCDYFMKEMGGHLKVANQSGGFAVILSFKLS